MKLKNKMIIAFLIMTILPILLFILTFYFVFRIQTNNIRKAYGLPEDYKITFYDLYSPANILGEITEQSYEEVRETSIYEPEKLTDVDYLDHLSARLDKKLSSIVVTQNGYLIYNSTQYSVSELKSKIPNELSVDDLGNVGFYESGEMRCLIKLVPFKDDSNNSGVVYIFTSMKQSIPEFKTLLFELILIVLEVLFVTALILIFWNNQSFIKPISRLRLATKNIKNGNLDFKIDTKAKDELGDLSRDFENMRHRLKESADEQARYEKEEKELIRNISHDLKTPLTAIKGYIEGLIDGIADTEEKRQRYLLTIKNKAEDMDRLIEQLTLFSRLDSNKIPYDFIKINVKNYFDDCVDEIRMDLESQGIVLEYKYDCDNEAEIMADPNQLKRVINNLIGNSVKYKSTERQCDIKIGVFDEGDYLHIAISDNGKGIAAKDLSRIFDRFYRTDESRTSPQSGSGIGLAIVKKIIEDHKGRIWADSVEGEGTTFHINLLRYKEGGRLSLPDNQRKSSRKKKK